ncbi:sigma-70 family RNA polymerase sigma factor [Romboutsia lituseburensis]|uniref:sigma-70 family RNA polymerase sigma factor n=1 Tax=Romboutsia lituseburensis TaxID=1537 RepID=UPI00215B0474|nr:sigma-70 family RNA polymerase sigma factor [Romboutsia lituseburensis]MCR8746900.1 sigma-70 family RNA polymerase sigma factor [Romboutsia lituseburensis]
MKINEENFIQHLKLKNEKALVYVIDNYGWIINGSIKKYLYNLKDYQEECFNDILLGIWNNIDNFDESKNSFKNWVGAISKYKTIDYKRKYYKYIEKENIDELSIPSKENIFEEVTKNELSEELDKLLNNLSCEDKALFLKLFVEGKAVESVSKEMNIHKNNIYNRVSRGKSKLRKLFIK